MSLKLYLTLVFFTEITSIRITKNAREFTCVTYLPVSSVAVDKQVLIQIISISSIVTVLSISHVVNQTSFMVHIRC